MLKIINDGIIFALSKPYRCLKGTNVYIIYSLLLIKQKKISLLFQGRFNNEDHDED